MMTMINVHNGTTTKEIPELMRARMIFAPQMQNFNTRNGKVPGAILKLNLDGMQFRATAWEAAGEIASRSLRRNQEVLVVGGTVGSYRDIHGDTVRTLRHATIKWSEVDPQTGEIVIREIKC